MRIIFICIAILVGFNNVFAGFSIATIRYERLLALICFAVFFKKYLEELKTNSFFRVLNIFIVSFAIIQLVMHFKLAILEGAEFKLIYIGLFKSLTYIAYLFLILLIAKSNIKNLNFIIYVHLFICVIALLHHPLSPFAMVIANMKRALLANIDSGAISMHLLTQETGIRYGSVSSFRLSGPFPSTISLTYTLFGSLCLNLFMYYKLKKQFYLFTSAFIVIISILTQTRSLVMAEALIILALMVFNYSEKRNFYKIVLVAGAFLFAIVYYTKNQTSTNESRMRIDTEDNRPLMWYTGLMTVAEHPFGVTEEQYNRIRDTYSMRFEEPEVRIATPHNGLINIGFNYTILGYPIIILFFVFLFKRIQLLDQNFLILANMFIIGYLLHTSFHNRFFLIDDYDILIVFALLNLLVLKREREIESHEK